MMKLTLALLAGSAAAFAPSKVAQTSTALNMAFESELGVQPPLGFFDPLGLLEDADQERFDRLRYVEVKHGRICQLAFLGNIITRAGIHLPGSIDLAGDSFDSFPNGWAAVGAKSKMSSAIYLNQNEGWWSEFFGDVYSGIAVGLSHPKWFVEKTIGQGMNAIASLTASSSVASDEDSSSNRNSSIDEKVAGGLKVIGVGYGRTGTYSLALALDELGFPTLHTQHLYENPKIFTHFVDNIFYKSIQQDTVITPDMYTPDFNLLLKGGYTATMDLPFALYYEQVHELYPDCKFILTVRENSEVWFRSWDVLTKSITQPAQYGSFFFTHVNRLNYYLRWLFSVVNNDKTYLNAPFPLPPQNKAKAIASYEAHNERVRSSIPASNLLEYNVREGWEPLCEFLEIAEADCPSTQGIPFPKSNSARAVTWQSYSSFIGPLVLTVFILFSLFSFVWRKITGMSVIDWCLYVKAGLMRRTNESLTKRKNKSKMGVKVE